MRSSEADGLFFSTFLDYSDRDKIPRNFLSEWKAAKKWFLGHAHLREKPFRIETDDDLVKHFECLEPGWRLRSFSKILDLGPGKKVGLSIEVGDLNKLLPDNMPLVVACFAKITDGLDQDTHMYFSANEVKPILRRVLPATQ